MEKWEGRKCWEDRKVEDETFGWTMKSEKIENVVYMHLCPYYKKKEKKNHIEGQRAKKSFDFNTPHPHFFSNLERENLVGPDGKYQSHFPSSHFSFLN